MTIALPAGAHVVELDHVPVSLYVGATIMGVTVFVTLIVVFWSILPALRNRAGRFRSSE